MHRPRRLAALAVTFMAVAACSSNSAAPHTATVPASSSVVSVPKISTSNPAMSASVAAAATTRSGPPVYTTDPLTGGAPSTNPVLAVKIDNTYFAAPQFGVSSADIVFVEQVEGGLTRLIGVFHTDLNVEVGPVRSVRSTDAQLLPVFGKPGLVFSGGAGGPLADLAKASIVDTSKVAATAYFRSSAATGDYNLHATLNKVAALTPGLGYVQPIGLNFIASDPEVAAGPATSNITVTMESGILQFQYSGGHFVRKRNGSTVSDDQGQVEAADNVLVQHVTDVPDGTVDVAGSPSYLTKTIGSGKVTLYRDGHAIEGTWSRASAAAPFVYKDAAGNPLPFKPGKTWILLAPQTAVVSTS